MLYMGKYGGISEHLSLFLYLKKLLPGQIQRNIRFFKEISNLRFILQ